MTRKLGSNVGSTRANKTPSPYLYVDRSMVKHKAWLSLTGASLSLYLLFCTKKVLGQKPRRNIGKSDHLPIVNNGEIEFTYIEAQDQYRFTAPRFSRAIDQLVDHGFIDVTHAGGGFAKEASNYAFSNRWKKYGTPEFEKVKRQKGVQGHRFPRKTQLTKSLVVITNENVTGAKAITNKNVSYEKSLELRNSIKNIALPSKTTQSDITNENVSAIYIYHPPTDFPSISALIFAGCGEYVDMHKTAMGKRKIALENLGT